jgi:hypothetical protein
MDFDTQYEILIGSAIVTILLALAAIAALWNL